MQHISLPNVTFSKSANCMVSSPMIIFELDKVGDQLVARVGVKAEKYNMVAASFKIAEGLVTVGSAVRIGYHKMPKTCGINFYLTSVDGKTVYAMRSRTETTVLMNTISKSFTAPKN